MSERIEIRVPDIGDFADVEVIEVLVAPGDSIKAEDSLITLESDKAAIEIPSTHSGVVKEVMLATGDTVSEGALILVLEVDERVASAAVAPATAADPAPAPAALPQTATDMSPPAPVAAAAPRPSPTAQIDPVRFNRAHASPSVRRFARELGADLSKIKGSGRSGRILKQDVQGYIKQLITQPATSVTGLGVEPMPTIDFGQWGGIETQPLTKINRLTGRFLHRNWVTIPHVTQFDAADITDLEAFRQACNQEYSDQGVKFTLLAFMMKAVVAGLKKYPRFNSSLDPSGEALILKHYFHIGIAVDTADGLVVPVVRDVDQKSLVEISIELKQISIKARDKKLKPADMQGGCMTISSLGGIGGTQFTPIVNAPEVAILGVSRSEMKPVWSGTEFVPRLMCPLSLSYDHRVIDGAAGARFTTYLCHMLSDARRMLL